MRPVFLFLIPVLLIIPPSNGDFCSGLLASLSGRIKDFIDCSMTHAVPVTYCLNCAKPYDDLMRAYTEINTKVDEKNVTCQSLYFNLDRLGLIQKSYEAGVGLWTSGYCDDCYETPQSVSNKTLEFLKLTDKFKQCTNKYHNEDVCTSCRNIYDRVNKNYANIKRHANDLVCFDLQDKINDTRRFWSIDVKCNTNPDDKQITFWIISAAVTALPICFYVLMFAHTHHSESAEENLNFLNESTTEPADEQENSVAPQRPSINGQEPGPSTITS